MHQPGTKGDVAEIILGIFNRHITTSAKLTDPLDYHSNKIGAIESELKDQLPSLSIPIQSYSTIQELVDAYCVAFCIEDGAMEVAAVKLGDEATCTKEESMWWQGTGTHSFVESSIRKREAAALCL